MSISKDVIKQCLISKQREVDEQGGGYHKISDIIIVSFCI